MEYYAEIWSHPYRDGQKYDEIRIFCENAEEAKRVMQKNMLVEHRTITHVSQEDNQVVLKLSIEEELANVVYTDEATGKKPVAGQPFSPALFMPLKFTREPNTEVEIDGSKIPIVRQHHKNVDVFESGRAYGLYYNLYRPVNIEKDKKYPLVIFIPDASVNGSNPKLALFHGKGATGFVEERFQEKFPCYVLALQVPERIPFVSDDYTCAEEFEDLMKILQDVIARESVDEKKMTLVGGSQGAMSSFELLQRYPGRFAGALLLGGHWDFDKVVQGCKNSHVWMMASDGDIKSYPCMTEAAKRIKEQGVSVAEYFWDAKVTKEEMQKAFQKAADGEEQVKLTVFVNHSVVPDGVADTGGSNHMCTWPFVYEFEEVRKWLLCQTINK